MFSIQHILSFDGNLFKLVRVFNAKQDFPIEEAKLYYNCDTVLKKENKYYLCNKIQEAEVLNPEQNESQIQLVEKSEETSTTPEEGRTEG